MTKPEAAERKQVLIPSSRYTAWWLLQQRAKLEEGQREYVRQLCETAPAIAEMQQLAQRSTTMVKERNAVAFSS